jgi:SAM-dependent methyltransferase
LKVFLHIGTHKTGTTALQTVFDENRELLKQHGVLYPSASPPPAEGLSHQGLASGLADPDQGASQWDPLLRELDLAEQDIAVISAEGFSVLRNDAVPLVRSYLADHDVTVVVYLRRQDEFLNGLYTTPVLYYRETRDLPQWREEERPDLHLDYRPLLRRWEGLFGRDSLIVRPYEKVQLEGGEIVSDFCSVIGVELPEVVARRIGLLVNKSYPRNAITVLRSLHHVDELEQVAPEVRQLFEILYRDERTESDLLSPDERLAILRDKEESNAEIAREYLGRDDGRLFHDLSVPSQQEWEKRYLGAYADLVATIRDANARLTHAQQLPYSTEVSPRDHMWNTAPEHYFTVGLSALACIEPPLAAGALRPHSILDMACGHGRVCRMLRARFPAARITACDIERDGVDFCVEEFGAEPVYSSERIEDIRMDRRFDLIWCGSFFTHMDREEFRSSLEVLAGWLEPGGILVFTTHGRQVVNWIRTGYQTYGLTEPDQRTLLETYEDEGFAFLSSEYQPAGFTISGMPFVTKLIEEMTDLKLVGFQEAGWAAHQDAVSIIRIAQPLSDKTSGQASDGKPVAAPSPSG